MPSRRCPPPLVVAALAALLACGEGGPTLPSRAPVKHLLMDLEHVELLEGFGPVSALEAWHDPEGENPDRAEIAVRVFRNSRLRWRLDAPPGSVLRLGLTRMVFGTPADGAPCSVHLRLLDGREGELAHDEVAVPPAAADPAAREHAWREGPVADVRMTSTAPVHTLELEIVSDDVPPSSLLGLLSPRVEQPSRPVPLSARPVPWPDEQRALMPRLELDEAARAEAGFASWRSADPEAVAEREAEGVESRGELRVPLVREEGAFFGYKPRHALALLDGAVARWWLEDLGGLHLRGAVALDQRLPAGAEAAFVVLLDGELVARLPVRATHWQPVDVDLGLPPDDARERLLEIALEGVALPDGEARVHVPDLMRGKAEPVDFDAERLRAGFAEPRLETPGGEMARRPATADQPSVLLVHVETLRADVLGGAGVPAELTPTLARLAAAGVHYTEAVAPSPWTLPSSATLFTGLSPSAHGVVAHDRAVLPAGAVTLAERLRAAGWITAGMVTNTLLNAHAGWARGFTEWVELPHAQMRQVGALARDWVAAQGDTRWFLFLHPFDPHGPDAAPGEFRERFVEPGLRGHAYGTVADVVIERMKAGEPLDPGDPELRYLRQRYWGEVAFLDRELDRLLDALDAQGVLDTTLLVLTADHGEEFGEHGFWGHGSNLFDPATRVPLLLVPAGALAGWAQGTERADGRRVEQVVSTDGLHATLLGVLGLHDAPEELGLRPALGRQGDAAAWIETDKALTRVPGGDPLRRAARAVRSATHLLVRRFPVAGETDAAGAPVTEPVDLLFALDAEGGAPEPLPAAGAEYERLAAFLEAQLERVEVQAVRRPGAGGGVDRLEHLRALGYLQDAAGAADGEPARDG